MAKNSHVSRSADGDFSYEAYPNSIIYRREGKESFRKMVKMLTDGREEIESLEIVEVEGQDPELTMENKLRARYRQEILGALACCAVSPKVDLKAMKARILKRENSDVVAFNKAVSDILSELGL